MSQKSGAAQYGQPSGRGIFFPSANISEIRPKDQIKKDFHESFIDSHPFYFFFFLFSQLPMANVSSLFDSGGVFTPFSPEHHGKSLLKVIFSDLCSLATCWSCQQLALLLKEVLCWCLGGGGGEYGSSLLLKTHLLRSQTCKCWHTHAPCELCHWFR